MTAGQPGATNANLEEILSLPSVWRGNARLRPGARVVSTGVACLDRELGGGWPTGALTEVSGLQEGIGELQLVIPAIAMLSVQGQRIAWLAPPHLPYAPALTAAGVNLRQLIVVRAPGRRDTLWAAEQVLRAGQCSALLLWLRNASYAELRRLSVAAESGRTFVAIFRPRSAMRDPSPAALRIGLESGGSELLVHFLKHRGAPGLAPLRIALDRPGHALDGFTPAVSRARRTAARSYVA